MAIIRKKRQIRSRPKHTLNQGPQALTKKYSSSVRQIVIHVWRAVIHTFTGALFACAKPSIF